MKKLLVALAFVVVFALVIVVCFRAYLDYNWADMTIQEMAKKGFVVLYSSSEHKAIAAPWSYLSAPVTSIWLTKPDLIKQHTHYLEIPIVKVSYKYLRGADQHVYYTVYNIITQRMAIISPDSFKSLDDETWTSVTASAASLAIYRRILALAGKDSLFMEVK